MKLQRRKSVQYILVIFLVICGILAAVSVFAGGVLTPVKSAVTMVLSPMQKGINSVGNTIFSWNEEHKTNSELKEENDRLNERLDALRMQNRLLEQDQVELERLQDLLDLKEKL